MEIRGNDKEGNQNPNGRAGKKSKRQNFIYPWGGEISAIFSQLLGVSFDVGGAIKSHDDNLLHPM